MKQRIKELLKLAPVSVCNSRSSYGYGDTYERYCERCHMSDLYRKLGLRRRVDLIKFNSTELAGLQ